MHRAVKLCRWNVAMRPLKASPLRSMSTFKDEYMGHVAERLEQGIVPKPLDAGMMNVNYERHFKLFTSFNLSPLNFIIIQFYFNRLLDQISKIIELLKAPPAGEEEFLLDLITNRCPPVCRQWPHFFSILKHLH